MLRVKIVCTVGPASRDPATLEALIHAGMNVARLNMSHGDADFHRENIRRIRQLAEQLGKPVAILADLQGPKLRVGVMPPEGVPLTPGETLILTTEPIVGGIGRVPVQYERLPESVKPGDRILIDDGLLELKVIGVEGNEIQTQVVTGGVLMSNKGLNLPRAALSIPAITEKDREDLRFALEEQVDWIALSFVRTADEVLELKDTIRELSALGRPTPVIAKIEKPEAIDNIDAIIAAADGIMVARGDLGIEMSTEAVPMVQKTIIHKCNHVGKPVITATQMLDSMIRNPRPTRAEASDVANAILDGSDAIMLSGETAAGKYPVLAVETMARIACETEIAHAALPTRPIAPRPVRTFAEAVAHASVDTAIDLNAAAIIAPTVSGETACTIARFRPHCSIVAVTPSPITQRRLMLVWGVYPILAGRADNTDQVISDAIEAAQRRGYVKEGDVIILTGGSVGYGVGTTNLMKVHLIERVLAHGEGLGERRIIGRIRRLTSPLPADMRPVDPEEIVVTACTDRTFVPILRRAAGLVTSDSSPDSHCRMLAMEMGIPAVVGIREGVDALPDGLQVVLDAKRGLVFERPLALVHVED
ncbi:MAG: pyruvate kinase [Chloroflexi bacterium]|nr:pyruvate kinase [Chloroflexota bacterium]